MKSQIQLDLVYPSGFIYLSDLNHLASTPNLRQKLLELFNTHFSFTKNFLSLTKSVLVSLVSSFLALSVFFILYELVKSYAFIALGCLLVIVVVTIVQHCRLKARMKLQVLNVIYLVEKWTDGVHTLEGKYKWSEYVNTFYLTTDVGKLEMISPNSQNLGQSIEKNESLSVTSQKEHDKELNGLSSDAGQRRVDNGHTSYGMILEIESDDSEDYQIRVNQAPQIVSGVGSCLRNVDKREEKSS